MAKAKAVIFGANDSNGVPAVKMYGVEITELWSFGHLKNLIVSSQQLQLQFDTTDRNTIHKELQRELLSHSEWKMDCPDVSKKYLTILKAYWKLWAKYLKQKIIYYQEIAIKWLR